MGLVEIDGTPESLLVNGALIEVVLTVPLPLKQYLEREGLPAQPAVRGFGLIDTGAGVSGVEERVMVELGIPSLESIETLSPHGVSDSNVYNASITLPQFGGRSVPLEQVIGCYLGDQALPQGARLILLLGRDLLKDMAVYYDGKRGRFTVEV
jgi:hypothetical protein